MSIIHEQTKRGLKSRRSVLSETEPSEASNTRVASQEERLTCQIDKQEQCYQLNMKMMTKKKDL